MTVYRVVSSDSHIVEPPDIWTERMPKKFGDRIPRLVHEEHGDWWYADGIRLLSISAGTDAGVRFERPGDYRKEAYFEQVRPGAYLPPEKLKDMDADGVYGEVIYPTLPLHFWRLADGELLSAIYHAYNDWAADFRTANPHRVKLSAAINLDGVHDGVRELERIADLGLATAMITVSPPDEYSYDNPIYDPFWAAAQDLDLPLSLHIGTNRRMPSEVHVDTRMPLRALSTDALRSTGAYWVQLSLANMIFGGVFERFPKLKVISVEHEAAWAAHFIQTMDMVYTRDSRTDRKFKERVLPSDFFHRNVSISFQEDRLAIDLRSIIGADNLMWGSDYPHPESTFPQSQRILDELFDGVPEADERKMLSENAAQVFRFN